MSGFGFAVVGCGHIAHKHAQAIEETKGSRLVAVYDPDTQRARDFAQKYNAAWYDDYSEMLKYQAVNIVCICSPSGLHAEQGIEAARAGKHVLMEKPMALSVADADRLIEACNEARVKLSVVYQNRFKPVIQKLRRAMDQQLFGTLTHGNATVRWNRNDDYFSQSPWRGATGMDGGVLMNQAIHNIDLLQWLMGPMESVFAYATTRIRKIDGEDVGVAVLRFANGALGVIEAATTIYPKNLEESLSIFGSKGSAIISGVTASDINTWLFEKDQEDMEGSSTLTGHRAVIEDLIKAIDEDVSPLVDGEEGKKSMEIVLSIYESARKGIPVKINE